MTSNIGSRQLKDFGQGVGFSTTAKSDQADDHAKRVIENALKKAFAHRDFTKNAELQAFDIALVYIETDETEKAFEWLEKAAKTFRFNFFRIDPRLEKIRSDARFANLLATMKN